MVCLVFRFTKPLYTTRVSSPLTADTPLLRLLAVDHDIGTNALLRFSITAGNDGAHFKIDSTTGIISSGKRFSSKEKKTFQLDVEVKDSGATHVFKDRSTVKVCSSMFLYEITELGYLMPGLLSDCLFLGE